LPSRRIGTRRKEKGERRKEKGERRKEKGTWWNFNQLLTNPVHLKIQLNPIPSHP
jgi:hypothetical protein